MSTAMHPLPEYGPLEIDSLERFLNDSKYTMSKLLRINFNGTQQELDFTLLSKVKIIGSGSFGVVSLVKDNNNRFYAVKAIEKIKILQAKQMMIHIRNEKKILSVMNFPFVVHLIKYAADNFYIYFVLPFVAGGDLFNLLRKFIRFDEVQSRFYTAQVALALEYLHFNDLIFRDLKPENILLDHTGYLKLTDFGFGKCVKTRTWTFCGTPEYLAPEIILNKGYGKSVDWWAFGVLLFETVCGRSPFEHRDLITIFEKIVAANYSLPSHISPECKFLITNLLQPNVSKRLGNLRNGVQDIKDCAWFRPIDWMTILNRRMNPPYVPGNHQVKEVFGEYNNQRFVEEFEDF